MKLPAHIRYLAVEGVIGVGKSSLVELISQRLDARLLMENFAANPFLEKFYENHEAWAFQTQLFFLLSRFQQLQDTFEQQDIFRPVVVSDYTLDKDHIFAAQNLSEHELDMYYKVVTALQREVVKPDFVVYLQASIPTLQERIKKRDRAMERKIDSSYLRKLSERYNHHFLNYQDAPVLIVNTDNIDFVNNEDDLDSLIREIAKCPLGLNFYAPQSSS